MPDAADDYHIFHSWIEACEGSDRLTEWEYNFVASVKKQLETKGSLSPKQIEVLERIYADKTN